VHDLDYRASLQDFTTFLEQLSEKVSTIDETVPELPVKDLVSFLTPPMPNIKRRLIDIQIFRIYRGTSTND
jgi:hypothetical protein